ncbi:MAG: DUF819 family protein [Bacteroidota bacterium]
MEPFFTNDAVVLGLLLITLAAVFATSSSKNPIFQRFYRVVPPLLLCYFLPALLHWPLGLISGEESKLYFVASRYLLPASLVLLCLSIDFKGILNLGPKALIMFFAATLGIVLGGPIALLVLTYFFPDLVNVTPDELWRGLSTVAGSWIGGGANQTAMKEIFEVGDDLFSTMIVVDVLVANIWMGFLLYGANISERIDRSLKADTSAIEDLKKRVSEYRSNIERIPTTTDVFIMLAVAFGAVALSHWGKDTIAPSISAYNDSTKPVYEYQEVVALGGDTSLVRTLEAAEYERLQTQLAADEQAYLRADSTGNYFLASVITTPGYKNGVLVEKGLSSLMSGFFWLIVIATTIGVLLSFTRARELEGVGASRWGSVFIYILVATIGMKMNIGEILGNLGLFAIGIVWMLVHVIILLLTAYLIKAPFFFVAVGSQANVGGAASAPVVASAFSPALAPVGVLMAVLGYALGTYGAIVCALLMQGVATG